MIPADLSTTQFLLALLATIILYRLWRTTKRSYTKYIIPPFRANPWPIVSHFVFMLGGNLRDQLNEWWKKTGNIYSLDLAEIKLPTCQMACSCIAKCLLSLINTIFQIIAVAFIVAGVIIAFVPNVYLDPAYEAFKKAADSTGYSIPLSSDELKYIPLVHSIGIALFIIGIFLLALTVLVWCGTCCTSCCRWLLIVFAVVTVLLMIAEIVVATLFYVTDSPLHTAAKNELKSKIKSDYQLTGNDDFSKTINFVNHYFECCGIDSRADFGLIPPHPLSCDPANYQKGCYKKFTDLITDKIAWVGLVTALLLAIQLVEVILAIIIFQDQNKIWPV